MRGRLTLHDISCFGLSRISGISVDGVFIMKDNQALVKLVILQSTSTVNFAQWNIGYNLRGELLEINLKAYFHSKDLFSEEVFQGAQENTRKSVFECLQYGFPSCGFSNLEQCVREQKTKQSKTHRKQTIASSPSVLRESFLFLLLLLTQQWDLC